jgi:hydroxyacylglutathione hydrolase
MRLKPTDIFITHHHEDHHQAVSAVVKATGARVTGGAADAHRLPPLDRQIKPGDTLTVGAEKGQVIDVPGHTIGHLAFHFPASKIAFTADSLMAMGCGRLMEGTPTQMWESLQRLASLPRDTLICSGHEYTASNSRFAETLEPNHPELISRMAAIKVAREAGQPTVPSLLSLELSTNPFLRASDPAMKAAIGKPDASDVASFAEIRARKDKF